MAVKRLLASTYLCKMTSKNVGSDMAKYSWDQLLQKLATPGRSITPIDQNCSNMQIVIVLNFPPVMSFTAMDSFDQINLSSTLLSRLYSLITLPAVYIKPQQMALKHRKSACISYA